MLSEEKRKRNSRKGLVLLAIKVMVVDDSAFMRQVLKEILETDPDL